MMTVDQAFNYACRELKARTKRVPIREFSKVHTTVSGNHKLDLYDRNGRICAIWMDGPSAQKLTRPAKGSATRVLIKNRREDYKNEILAAKNAERKGGISEGGRALRAALHSLYSYFDGHVAFYLSDAYEKHGMEPPKRRHGRDPSLRETFQCLRKYAKEELGATIQIPDLRTWAKRDIITHPAIEKKDPARYTKRLLSANDANKLGINEVESDAAAIEKFLSALWRAVKQSR
jgi:hypothetical protein